MPYVEQKGIKAKHFFSVVDTPNQNANKLDLTLS